MDRAALAMLRILENDEQLKDEAGNMNPRYDLRTKLQAFDKLGEWMKHREKSKPKAAEDDDSAGVDMLRELMGDPRALVERFIGDAGFIKALDAFGFIRVAPKPDVPGRLTKIAAGQRARVKEAQAAAAEPEADDDSQLRKLIKR